MGQADELLNSLTEDSDSPLLRLANPETEPHVVIGDDRFIAVPKELQRIAVQYDHDVETVTFDCPRYWDGLDMSTLNIYINYRRKDRVVGSYKAQNVTIDEVDPNIMHFDWTISRNVTQVNGGLIFLVCIKKGDEDGNEINHWNSELNTEMYISEGLETGETIVSPYPDLVLQWEDEVQAVKDILLTARDSGELDGATFTPSVDGDGNLSWTNDKGRENPETVNIKGYSPTMTAEAIEGGVRLTVTDVNGTQSVDVINGTDGVDGTSPTMTAEAIEGGVRLTVTDVNGAQSVDVMNGTNGTDGYSPVILVQEIEGGKQLIITDQKQTQTVTIMDGVDGKNGADAVSPTVTTEAIEGGNRITVMDVSGSHSFDIINGTDGTDGQDGYSPTILVREIEGGKELTITDYRQSQTVTIMDGAAGKDGADAVSPTVTITPIEGGNRYTITGVSGSQSFDVMNGVDGTDGKDGVSPTVTITPIEGGNRCTITDVNGSQSFDIMNGTDGTDGKDGVSPTVTVTAISGGHRVSITDANGTQVFDVMDGTQDISEATAQYLNNYVYIGTVEPTSGPVLWFDTSSRSGE